MQSSVFRRGLFSGLPGMPVTLFVLTMMLVALGLVMVYSASASPVYLARQAAYGGIGLAGMLCLARLNYSVLRKAGTGLMVGSFATLVAVKIFGAHVNGAQRWLNLGPIRFQPSELAKLAMVIYMAKMLSERRPYLQSFFSGVLPACIITGIFTALIVIEPDFGAALVLGLTIFGMWVAAEMRWFHLTGLVVAATPAAVFAFLMKSFRMQRLFAFLHLNDKDVIQGVGLQIYQSLISVGSGGWWGRGLGQSVQKYYYLPECHTDFIFAIMCEELGFIRVSLVILAFAALVMLGWRVAMRAPDMFGSLLATGITLMIFLNTAINMGVVLGKLPTKGMVLPYVSYGGSGLVIYMWAMGVLINVAGAERALSSPRFRQD
jgi:cell division protein FtsW